MKKIVLLVFTVALIFSFAACNGNTNDLSPVEEGYQIFDKHNQIGETYTKEMAEKANDVIMYHDGVHNIDRLKQFITDVENDIEQQARITLYTIEGDPIIYFLHHKDSKTMLWIDNTRDQFASKVESSVKEYIVKRFQIDESNTERIYVAITDSGEEINLVREGKIQDYTKENIESLLNKENGSDITWAKSKEIVAYAKWEDTRNYADIYIWKVGDPKPTRTNGRFSEVSRFIWSPTEEYIFVDSGTSIHRNGDIISILEGKVIKSLSYIGKTVWSPNSKSLAFLEEGEIAPVIETELNGSTNVVIYDLETGEKKTIDKGTAEYHFSRLKWAHDNTLDYYKIPFKNPDVQEKVEIKIKKES